MARYIQAENTGIGFITHEDWEENNLTFEGFMPSLWKITGDCDYWIARVNGVELTQEEAQTLFDTFISELPLGPDGEQPTSYPI